MMAEDIGLRAAPAKKWGFAISRLDFGAMFDGQQPHKLLLQAVVGRATRCAQDGQGAAMV